MRNPIHVTCIVNEQSRDSSISIEKIVCENPS